MVTGRLAIVSCAVLARMGFLAAGLWNVYKDGLPIAEEGHVAMFLVFGCLPVLFVVMLL